MLATIVVEKRIECGVCRRRWKPKKRKFPAKCPRCRTRLELPRGERS